MNRRRRYLLNIACLALLMLALYLNFVRKDTDGELPPLHSTELQRVGTSSEQGLPSASAPTTTTTAP